MNENVKRSWEMKEKNLMSKINFRVPRHKNCRNGK